MMRRSLSVLCLSLLLFHTHFSLAGRGGKSSPKTSNKGSNTQTSNSGHHKPAAKAPRAPPRKEVKVLSPPNSGRSGHMPRPPHGGSYGGRGGYGGQGGYGGYGGGYINRNPNNRILSPHYGGSYGYGRGSPFSNSVREYGVFPSDKSRGFGRSAAMAAGGGAVAGMAVGYGLGNVQQPHFQFRSRQEEHKYNDYMYRKQSATGSGRSTDTKEGGNREDYREDDREDYRDRYRNPPMTYESYMESCMRRKDLLPTKTPKSDSKPVASTTAVPSAPHPSSGSLTSAPSSLPPPTPPTSPPQAVRYTATNNSEDDDTVSIVEIGYPALIQQLKIRRCLEMYILYSENYAATGGVPGLERGSQEFVSVVTSTVLVLLNSILMLN